MLMDHKLSNVLISKEEIAQKVNEIGRRITEDYKGEPVFLVCILKGSLPFTADLMRVIDLDDVQIDCMSVSSYGNSTQTSGVVRIVKDLDTDITGRNVIIVEDIVDSGLTLQYLCSYLRKKGPKSIKTCSFLDKPSRRKVDIKPDYVGFEVEDRFIVGYGLDEEQKCRNLPYIAYIEQ